MTPTTTDEARRDHEAEVDPVGATHPGRAVMPGRDFPTNLGQLGRTMQQAHGGALGQIADGFWRFVLAPVRAVRRRSGWQPPAVAAEPDDATLDWGQFLLARARRRRRDLLLAAGTGAAVAAGLLLLADGLPERSTAAILARQAWWLAGAFWAGFVFLVRRWLA